MEFLSGRSHVYVVDGLSSALVDVISGVLQVAKFSWPLVVSGVHK